MGKKKHRPWNHVKYGRMLVGQLGQRGIKTRSMTGIRQMLDAVEKLTGVADVMTVEQAIVVMKRDKGRRKAKHEPRQSLLKYAEGHPASVLIPRKKTAKELAVEFYTGDAWRHIRYQALKVHGGACQCCGVRAGGGVVMHVDHIKPRSKFPELTLVLSNLQVLCEDCNLGKRAWDETDWRNVVPIMAKTG